MKRDVPENCVASCVSIVGEAEIGRVVGRSDRTCVIDAVFIFIEIIVRTK